MNPTFDKENLFKAITQAQNSFLAEEDTGKIFDHLLVALLELTGSEYGYIGEVFEMYDGTRFLKTHAISNIAWNKETRQFYEENAPEGLEFRNLNSLFGHVLTEEDVVIANEPGSDPRAGGLPEGHPPLNAYLGLPFFTSGRLVGSAGISNRSGGYNDEMVEFLQPFMATCANIIMANRAKHLQEKNENMKSEFISIISHELRTPMTSIQGALKLLESLHGNDFSKEAMQLLQLANSGSDRMLRLLNEILDVEKLESGTSELRIGECNFLKIINNSLSELMTQAEDKHLKVEVDCLDSIVFKADADRISQIIINLVSNAIKFTEKGIIKVSCKDLGDNISLEITDTGMGISHEQIESIFDKFHQVADVNTRSSSGVGLGLYIVKSLVSLHGGSIDIKSELDKGTTFTITFKKKWTAGNPEEK